jgi:putative effector of murein hydrolase
LTVTKGEKRSVAPKEVVVTSVDIVSEPSSKENKISYIDCVFGGVLVLIMLVTSVLWWQDYVQVDVKTNVLGLAVTALAYRLYKLEREVVRLREIVNKK